MSSAWREWMEGLRRWMESQRQWAEEHRHELEDWREAVDEWREEGLGGYEHVEGEDVHVPRMPEMPPLPEMPEMPKMPRMPPMPNLFPKPSARSNVVASRIRNEELRVVDMLIEAGLFGTRSEAVAYLVAEGVRARQDMVEKVSTSLERIRRIRKETEEHVAKLRRDVGLDQGGKKGEAENSEKMCPKCGKHLSGLPEDISICPYCSSRLPHESDATVK